jgi:hypothetical protein
MHPTVDAGKRSGAPPSGRDARRRCRHRGSAPPVHIAVDGLTDLATRTLADGCFLQHPEFLGAWDLMVDLHDPGWPVLRRIDPAVADRLDPGVFLTETRAFFAPRAATWEQRFPDDDPAYAAAVAELRPRPGQTALDVGCGTGRALPHLRAGVGPDGQVVGFDLTPEMLATAAATAATPMAS